MTKTKRSIVVSVMIIMLAFALIATGSYALFTADAELTNHLSAGTLDITLKRTHLWTHSIDPRTGSMADSENPYTLDFSKPNDENVFDILPGTLIVPGCSYTAEMQIENNSDVPFGYWLEIVFDDSDNLALADQLYVKVSTVKGATEARLSESAGLVGKENDPIGILEIGDSQLFTINVEFLDLEDVVNNTAMNQSLEFDVLVHAVQIPSTSEGT